MWLPDGASLYDRLGAGFTLLGPAGPGDPAVAVLEDRARHRGIPLEVLRAPPDYPWGREFLLVRPDQHIAWRARDAAQIDLDLVTGHWRGDLTPATRPGPAGTERRRRYEQHGTRRAPAGRAGKTALTNVRVFDGQQLRPPATVVIEADRIGADPAGATVIDGDGGVLLPGLIDAHVHVRDRGTLERLASFGVTTVLDMANPSPALVDSLRSVPGLTGLRSAGTPALAPGSLHARMLVTDERAQVKSADQAGQFVADRVAEGSDYIKIVIGSPGADHDQATVDALVAAAHEHGKQAVAHASSYAAVAKAQQAGVDVLTHVPLDQALDEADGGRGWPPAAGSSSPP